LIAIFQVGSFFATQALLPRTVKPLRVAPAKPKAYLMFWLNDHIIQIPPIGVSAFNQFKLPAASPLFKAFFPLNSRFHAFVQFVPNEPVDAIAFCKSFYHIVLVFPYPPGQERSYAYVKSVVSLAREDVYNRLPTHSFCFSLDSGFRRNDENK
jgi:hypothetical protein